MGSYVPLHPDNLETTKDPPEAKVENSAIKGMQVICSFVLVTLVHLPLLSLTLLVLSFRFGDTAAGSFVRADR